MELTPEQVKVETIRAMEVIIEICKKIGIKYVLYYGSLIGAVRHGGFIPWDDDLDIAMLRPDYELFKKYCIENEDELRPYKLIGDFNQSNYIYNIPRFCDLRFRMETPKLKDTGMGIFIDVYPFDGVGSNIDRAKREFATKKNFYHSCVSYASGEFKPKYNGKKLRFVLRRVLYRYAKIVGCKPFKRKLYALKNNYSLDASEYVEGLVWGASFSPVPKYTFLKTEEISFEGIKVTIPKNYDEILTVMYGDYMTPPPPESRHPHHNYKIFTI